MSHAHRFDPKDIHDPMSLVELAAWTAIEQKWQSIEAENGPLGRATGEMVARGDSYVRSYRGGTITYSFDGSVRVECDRSRLAEDEHDRQGA